MTLADRVNRVLLRLATRLAMSEQPLSPEALWIMPGAFTSSIYLRIKLLFSSDSFVGWIVLCFWSLTEGEQWTRTCCRRPWRYFIFSLCYRTLFCYFFGFMLHFWLKKWGKHIFWDFCPYHLVLLCACWSACPGFLTTKVNGGLEILFEIWELAPWTLGYISTRVGSVANERNSRIESKGLSIHWRITQSVTLVLMRPRM